jgi:hypothetical protein
MLISAAGILLTLASFAVLAVDIGRIFIVRNELQNVADAAALAGANCLTRQSSAGSPVECISTLATSLNWARAAAKAEDHLSRNSAAQTAISSTDAGHQIEVGYFNVLTHSPSGGAFNTAFTPITANDKPAVRVFVRKDAGVNNGPIAMLTRLMFGSGNDIPMSAQAVAVISSPSIVPPSSLIPQAINQCMFDQFWDSTTGTPVIYTGDPPDPFGISTIGQPWTLRIGSSYHYGTCDSGQWTTFDLNTNSLADVKDLIRGGNPRSLEIGDTTWIKPGTAGAAYNEMDRQFPTPPGADITVLVVDNDGLDLSHLGPDGRQLAITAFAGFHIGDIQGGSDFYIEGHFIPSNVTPGGSGIGPFFGTYTPPRLGR